MPTDTDALRVLIADDNPAVSVYLQSFLETLDRIIMIEITHEGLSASQLIQSFKPHIILLDLMMPKLDGFEVCKQLKENPATKAIRIIAMTGYPSKKNIDRILATGAETCLQKPFDTTALMKAMKIDY